MCTCFLFCLFTRVLFVCVFVCLFVLFCLCLWVLFLFAYACLFVLFCLCVCFLFVRVCVCVDVRVCFCLPFCVSICICVAYFFVNVLFVCPCMYVCVYVSVYAYVCVCDVYLCVPEVTTSIPHSHVTEERQQRRIPSGSYFFSVFVCLGPPSLRVIGVFKNNIRDVIFSLGRRRKDGGLEGEKEKERLCEDVVQEWKEKGNRRREG